MKRKIKGVLVIAVTMLLTGCAILRDQPASALKITVESARQPILKRQATNPLVHIQMIVPKGKSRSYNKLQLLVDRKGIENIEKLEVFITHQPAFNADHLIGSLSPVKSKAIIPIALSLNTDTTHLWISATLKENADLDDKIAISTVNITDSDGRQQVINKPANSFMYRLGVAVRKPGDDGVYSYRIPGIATTDKGTLIAVYDIRHINSGDLPGNIDVGMSRSTDGGQNWQPMKTIMDMGAPHENNGIGDPAILFDPITKKIWVAALWSKGNRSIAGSKPGLSPDVTGQFVLVSSDDDGLTWSAPYSITSQVKNPKWNLFFNGPGNGIAMQNGHLVFPAQYWDENKMPHATIIYSPDHGKSWKAGIGAKSNTTESQVVETAPGTLMLNMRDNRGKVRSIATTKNYGLDWVEHPTSANTLADPVCMAGFMKAKVNVQGVLKEVLFFSNPNSSSERKDLTLKTSLDLGETWPMENQMLIDERGSYGYSAITKIDAHTIGLLYEGISDLYFVRIPVKELIK